MQKLIRQFDQAGSALVFAIVLGIVLSISGIAALRLITGGSSMSRRDIEVIKSYWANEGSLRVALRYVSCVNNLPNANIDPFATNPAVACNGYTPAVSIAAIPNANGTFRYSCTAVSVMPSVGLRNTTVLQNFTINSMSRYTWFEQQTGAQWVAMTVNGDYHTNGYINAGSAMNNTAHVTGKATTAGRINATQRYDRTGFPAPYNIGFRVTDASGRDILHQSANWFETRFPNYATVGTIQTNTLAPNAASFDNGFTVPVTAAMDSIAIQLNGTSVNIFKRQSGTWSSLQTMSLSAITGGILKCAKPTYVWGSLDGKLTLVTSNTGTVPSDIVVGSDITYANTDLSTSNDVLALVSAADVVIPNKTNNSTIHMSHDFTQTGGTVYGSLFMTGGGIDVQNIAGYSSMKNLNVYGGILLNKMAQGTFDQYTHHGISGQYYQDPRFVGNAALAPGIPFANAADPERAGAFMFVLGNGTWTNTIGVQ